MSTVLSLSPILLTRSTVSCGDSVFWANVLKQTRSTSCVRTRVLLRGFLNLATLDARGAHAKTLGGAVHDCADELQVEIPAPVGHVVSVTDPMPELRAAPADFTHFGHKNPV